MPSCAEAGEPYEQYVWAPRYVDAPVIRDRDSDGDGEAGDGSLGKTDSGLDERLFYVTDANFNVTALVQGTPGDADLGKVVERYACDPYGQVLVLDGADGVDPDTTAGDPDEQWGEDADGASDVANEILFCGYRLDPETSLYHVRHRMYHARLGRWLQRDPLGYVDGMSLYEYVGRDPLGLWTWGGLWEGIKSRSHQITGAIGGVAQIAAGAALCAVPTGISQVAGAALIVKGGVDTAIAVGGMIEGGNAPVSLAEVTADAVTGGYDPKGRLIANVADMAVTGLVSGGGAVAAHGVKELANVPTYMKIAESATLLDFVATAHRADEAAKEIDESAGDWSGEPSEGWGREGYDWEWWDDEGGGGGTSGGKRQPGRLPWQKGGAGAGNGAADPNGGGGPNGGAPNGGGRIGGAGNDGINAGGAGNLPWKQQSGPGQLRTQYVQPDTAKEKPREDSCPNM